MVGICFEACGLDGCPDGLGRYWLHCSDYGSGLVMGAERLCVGWPDVIVEVSTRRDAGDQRHTVMGNPYGIGIVGDWGGMTLVACRPTRTYQGREYEFT